MGKWVAVFFGIALLAIAQAFNVSGIQSFPLAISLWSGGGVLLVGLFAWPLLRSWRRGTEENPCEQLDSIVYEYLDVRGRTAKMSLAGVLRDLSEPLSAGMSRTDFQIALSKLWDGKDVSHCWKRVLMQLRSHRLVDIEHRPGAAADMMGRYRSIAAMPNDIYYLTDQGTQVAKKLLSD